MSVDDKFGDFHHESPERANLKALESMLRHGDLLDPQGVVAELIAELWETRGRIEAALDICNSNYTYVGYQLAEIRRVLKAEANV